jgi:uncharacterized membrane protein
MQIFKNSLFYITLALIITLGILLRFRIFDKQGGDYVTYKEAMNQFHQGINPYIQTVTSFENKVGEHGYGYLPTLLYILYFIWLLSNYSGIIISTVILWKIPTFICELFILYIIYKKAKDFTSWKHKAWTLLIVAFWYLNPYFIARYDFSLFDPLFLCSLLISLMYVGKKPFLSGVFYALSISLKTIPIILIFLMLLKTGNKIRFLIGGVLVAIIISLPFCRSLFDFNTFIKGAVLVHADRELQGRPILTYIFQYTGQFGVTVNQNRFFRWYAYSALAISATFPLVLYYKKKLSDKYTWVTISFFLYILITPVLSRTHLIWPIPFLALSLANFPAKTGKFAYSTGVIILIWGSMFIYLLNWDKGFKILDGKVQPYKNNTDMEIVRTFLPDFYRIKSEIKSYLK